VVPARPGGAQQVEPGLDQPGVATAPPSTASIM